MTFSFGKNENPLDLSKGADTGGKLPSKPTGPLPTPALGKSLPKPPALVKPPIVDSQQGQGQQRTSLPEPPQRMAPQPPQRAVQPQREPIVQEPVYSPQSPEQAYAEEQQSPQQGYASYDNQYAQAGQPVPQSNDYGQNQYNPNQGQHNYPAQQPSQSFHPTGSVRPGEAGYVAPIVETETEKPVKKGLFSSPKPKRESNARKGKGTKEKKVSAYTGSRSKVLWARIAVFSILGILILAGLNSFIPKSSGLTASDGPLILSQVRENLGVSNFPATAGAGDAVGFSKTYLSFDNNNQDARDAALAIYAPKNVISNIDPRLATDAELKVAAASGTRPTTSVQPGDTSRTPVITGKQVVTDGPYLTRSVMIQGGKDAIFTTRTQINGKDWVYMEIPMIYNPSSGNISVAGSPTFINPINTTNVPSNQYEPKWANDTEVVAAVSADMTNYMKAWSVSDKATLERLTVKENGASAATDSALHGLNGSLTFLDVSSLTVEQKAKPVAGDSQATIDNERLRQGMITVDWMEPSSGLVYSQTYSIQLQYVNNYWYVKDIQNIATTQGLAKDKL